MDFPLLLQCSPRLKGNSAFAASLAVEAIAERFPDQQAPQPLELCSHTVSPCIGCDVCSRPASHGKFFLGCPLSRNDDSQKLITAILQAPAVFFFCPIYHYHVPAQFKALLDRLQPFYWMQIGKTSYPPGNYPPRLFFPLLIAGQPDGQKLFEGCRLTLRYSLNPLNYHQGDWLELRGTDGPQALRSNLASQDMIKAFMARCLDTLYPELPRDEGV